MQANNTLIPNLFLKKYVFYNGNIAHSKLLITSFKFKVIIECRLVQYKF